MACSDDGVPVVAATVGRWSDPGMDLQFLLERMFQNLQKAQAEAEADGYDAAIVSYTNALSALRAAIPLQAEQDERAAQLLREKFTEYSRIRTELISEREVRHTLACSRAE